LLHLPIDISSATAHTPMMVSGPRGLNPLHDPLLDFAGYSGSVAGAAYFGLRGPRLSGRGLGILGIVDWTPRSFSAFVGFPYGGFGLLLAMPFPP
jgi:hypothetical protein